MENYAKKHIKHAKMFIVAWTLLALFNLLASLMMSIHSWSFFIHGALFGFSIGMIIAAFAQIKDTKFAHSLFDMIDHINELWLADKDRLSKDYFDMANQKQKLEQQLKKYKGGKK